MEKELKLNQIITDLMEGRTHPITAKTDILILFDAINCTTCEYRDTRMGTKPCFDCSKFKKHETIK